MAGSRPKPTPVLACAVCGKPVVRERMNGGRWYPLGQFKKRKYCSTDCMAAGLQKLNVTKCALHVRAAKLRGSSCEVCGGTYRLHAHHVDNDPANNVPENIQTLCTHCHNKHHHQAKREGRAIAGRMTERLLQ